MRSPWLDKQVVAEQDRGLDTLGSVDVIGGPVCRWKPSVEFLDGIVRIGEGAHFRAEIGFQRLSVVPPDRHRVMGALLRQRRTIKVQQQIEIAGIAILGEIRVEPFQQSGPPCRVGPTPPEAANGRFPGTNRSLTGFRRRLHRVITTLMPSSWTRRDRRKRGTGAVRNSSVSACQTTCGKFSPISREAMCTGT